MDNATEEEIALDLKYEAKRLEKYESEQKTKRYKQYLKLKKEFEIISPDKTQV